MISGPSGVGKGTLVSIALDSSPSLLLSVSVTTRSPRPGEVDGSSYHFISSEEFDELIRNDGLLEWAEIFGERYGTPASEVQLALSQGLDLILEIDPQGCRQIISHTVDGIFADQYQVITIFIAPPSIAELRQRLIHRGTESSEAIERRLNAAGVELEVKDSYDVVLVNDDLAETARQLLDIINQQSNL